MKCRITVCCWSFSGITCLSCPPVHLSSCAPLPQLPHWAALTLQAVCLYLRCCPKTIKTHPWAALLTWGTSSLFIYLFYIKPISNETWTKSRALLWRRVLYSRPRCRGVSMRGWSRWVRLGVDGEKTKLGWGIKGEGGGDHAWSVRA